jgi:hypothetical protein
MQKFIGNLFLLPRLSPIVARPLSFPFDLKDEEATPQEETSW